MRGGAGAGGEPGDAWRDGRTSLVGPGEGGEGGGHTSINLKLWIVK